MSGVEVAGLVLGSIPLLISGLEHYGEGVRTMQKWWGAAKEFDKLKETLDVEREIFRNDLQLLLKDDIEDRMLANMFLNADISQTWSDPRIDKCLQQRLGSSYYAYMGTAKRMGDSLREFRDSLQLGENGKGPFAIEKRSVKRVLSSVKFGLRMRKYEEMMDEILALSRGLHLLTGQRRELAPATVSKKRVPDFEEARQHARGIFSTLQRTLAISSGAEHRASLYMKPVDISGQRLAARTSPARFRIVLHHRVVDATRLQHPWIIEEAEIRPMRKESDDEEDDQHPARAVRFQVARGSTQRANQQPVEEIRDLCLSLKQLRASQAECDVCLGFLSDANDSGRHGLYWPDRPLIDQKAPCVLSLADVLDRAQGHSLGESDRTNLALALASGLLRLYQTPWLARKWGRREVMLFQRRGSIAAKHPFISAEIPVASRDISSQRIPYFNSCRLVKEETVFALGVVLIELAMKQPFEMLRTSEDLSQDGTKHELSDYYTADRILEELPKYAGDHYVNATTRCIQCQFDDQKKGLSSAAFRRSFYQGVVAELESELEYLEMD